MGGSVLHAAVVLLADHHQRAGSASRIGMDADVQIGVVGVAFPDALLHILPFGRAFDLKPTALQSFLACFGDPVALVTLVGAAVGIGVRVLVAW